jgi:uncharacterized RDD family membrane protein YckC
VSHEPSPAGFWKRFVAYFIDFMLVSMVLNVVTTPLVMVGLMRDSTVLQVFTRVSAGGLMTYEQLLAQLLPSLAWLSGLSMLGYALLAAAYFIGMEASARQATLGKQLLGLKVTALDGGRPGLGRVVGRFFAAGLSWLTLNVGHALAGWTRERRALHDYLAGTRVENVDPANAAMPTWGWVIVGLNGLLALLTVGGIAILAVMAWLYLMR